MHKPLRKSGKIVGGREIVESNFIINVHIFCFLWCWRRFLNIDCDLSMNMGTWRLSSQGIGRKHSWERGVNCWGQGDSGK